MKYLLQTEHEVLGSILCGLREKPKSRVNLKNIFFLAPLASFFVELLVWSCDIANQQNRSQVGENNTKHDKMGCVSNESY